MAQDNHALTPEQVEFYHTTGYLHLPHRFTAAEVDGWHAECDRLLASDLIHADNLRTRFRAHPDGGQILEKFDPVTDVSPVLRAVAADPRLVDAVAALFGEPGRLFKDKLIFKPAGADGYSVHQDYTWWQVFPPHKLLSVMVAIDGADADNGALEVAPGHHRRHLTPVGALRGLKPEELEAAGVTEWARVDTQPGDILLFHALTPHRSGRNTAPRSRRQFYPSYAPASLGDLYGPHYEHYRWYALKDEPPERQSQTFVPPVAGVRLGER